MSFTHARFKPSTSFARFEVVKVVALRIAPRIRIWARHTLSGRFDLLSKMFSMGTCRSSGDARMVRTAPISCTAPLP
eukprot:1006315-Prymnesium_polylepis.2